MFCWRRSLAMLHKLAIELVGCVRDEQVNEVENNAILTHPY